MRYQNWDVLAFPDKCKIPLQEFKTACQVIQDPELHNFQSNPLLLPTVTSFIPGLHAGAPFRISIHSWQNPDISRYIETLRKPTDQVVFEARIFIDGKIAGSKWFSQVGPWPTILDLSMDLDKHGEFEKIRFPTFHKELLSQSHWNAGDDFGRIKVVISEGFSRDNMSYPFERVKNLVSFSFQHAPLEVLEASSIAWPNASMWRQVALVGPYFAAQFSPRHTADLVDAHTHSPRRGNPVKQAPNTTSGFGQLFPSNGPIFPRQPTFDPFTDPTNIAFNGWRQTSGDVSMPDYSSNSRSNSSRQVTDPMSISAIENQDRRFEDMSMVGAYDSLCESLMPPAPVNTAVGTPQQPLPTVPSGDPEAVLKAVAANDALTKGISVGAAGSRKASVNAEPASRFHGTETVVLEVTAIGNVKSRKENMQGSPRGPDSGTVSEGTARRVAQALTSSTNNSNKRQRIITPASSKVIDVEDEPRTSPSLRKMSSKSMKQEHRDCERRVLSGIENI
ncbi:hypothetical protein BGZ60DRAFT_371700 [Tricladium varicosporioides]|nr:hypothetical protein BGZ60DRAFT_371700 [Hymenoscyphus varicosporioides]